VDLGLCGRTAFVSGSTQGIGYAIASALAAEGVRVTLNGRDPGRVHSAVDRLRAEVPDAAVVGVAADFSVAEQVAGLLDAVEDVDVLVNNVGLFEVAAFPDVSDESWRRYFEVNVMSGVRLSRRMLPRMMDRGWGRVIFIASESGVDVPAEMLHYGTTKAAMLALSNGLAKTTRETAVTVNAVLGGPTYSDGVARAVTDIAVAQGVDPDAVKAGIVEGRKSLLERFIEPRELADLVTFLASPRSSATNGAALRAEGGVLTTVI
jgi:NAD(P)-dependent dehydrogenase (short-subunit alcohol dehydrogenase family)